MRLRGSLPTLALLGLLTLLTLLGPACTRTSQETAGSPIAPQGDRVRVLGTVQDGGLPHAACTCVRCEAARRDPDRRRAVASLAMLLPDRGEVFLVDATPDVREQLDRVRDVGDRTSGGVNRAPVSGVLLTHAHIGHYTGLAFFGFEAIHTRGLPVWCTPRMARYLADNGPWNQLTRIGNVALREVRPGEPFSIGGRIEVTAIAVPHRDEYSDTVGFLLRGSRATLLYIPDTEPWSRWSRPITELLDGVDVAMLDGTFYSEHELPGRDVSSIGHPLITSTMDLLQPLVDAGTIEVYLTHLNHSNPALDPESAERAEMESRGFRVLEEGAEFPL